MIRASQLASYGVERASVNYHDASNFRLFAEAFIYGTTYDTYIHTYRHTDTVSVLHVYVGLAQARPNYIQDLKTAHNKCTTSSIYCVVLIGVLPSHCCAYTILCYNVYAAPTGESPQS